MSNDIRPGWYKDPSEPESQRYWDGEGWIGDPLPVDAEPPAGPPPSASPPPAPATSRPAVAEPRAEPSWNGAPGRHGTSAGGTSTGGTSTGGTYPGDTDERAPVAGGVGGTGGPERFAPGGAPADRGSPPGWPPGLPAPRPHGLALATMGGRVVARLIDILAVLGLAVVANAWFAYQWWQEVRPIMEATYQAWLNGQSTANIVVPGRAQTLELVMILLTMLAWFAYEVPAHAGTGQTPGKRVMGIKVMRTESVEPLGFRRAIRRWNPLGLPTLLWACYGLGLLWQVLVCLPAFRHPLHQGLHDRAAQTVVVALVDPYAPTPQPPSGGTP